MKTLWVVAPLVVLLALSGAVSDCGKSGGTVAAWFGATDRPQPPPITCDLMCDGSPGSTCGLEALSETAETTLRWAAERPGSIVRLWMQGRDIETTRIVAIAKSPSRYPTGRRARTAAQNRWIEKECAAFRSAASDLMKKPARRSPIAESIGVVALAPAPTTGRRVLVAVTDALEVSNYGRFECGRLPAPEQFARTLAERRILPPGSLAGMDVKFCHVDLGAIDGGRCSVSLRRAAEIRAIWRVTLSRAGASTVEIRQGGLDPSQPIAEKESSNVQTIQ